jgi:hypothetical protein
MVITMNHRAKHTGIAGAMTFNHHANSNTVCLQGKRGLHELYPTLKIDSTIKRFALQQQVLHLARATL